MCCDVILLILGIIVLIKGQVMLTRTKEVRGTPARVIGVLLILPLPLGFLAGLLLGAFYVAQGKPVTESEIQGVGYHPRGRHHRLVRANSNRCRLGLRATDSQTPCGGRNRTGKSSRSL